MNSSSFTNQDLLNVEWTHADRKYNLNSYGERPHRDYTLVDCKQKSVENYRFWYGLLSKWLEY